MHIFSQSGVISRPHFVSVHNDEWRFHFYVIFCNCPCHSRWQINLRCLYIGQADVCVLSLRDAFDHIYARSSRRLSDTQICCCYCLSRGKSIIIVHIFTSFLSISLMFSIPWRGNQPHVRSSILHRVLFGHGALLYLCKLESGWLMLANIVLAMWSQQRLDSSVYQRIPYQKLQALGRRDFNSSAILTPGSWYLSLNVPTYCVPILFDADQATHIMPLHINADNQDEKIIQHFNLDWG